MFRRQTAAFALAVAFLLEGETTGGRFALSIAAAGGETSDGRAIRVEYWYWKGRVCRTGVALWRLLLEIVHDTCLYRSLVCRMTEIDTILFRRRRRRRRRHLMEIVSRFAILACSVCNTVRWKSVSFDRVIRRLRYQLFDIAVVAVVEISFN